MNISQLISIASSLSDGITQNDICNRYQSLINLCKEAQNEGAEVTSEQVETCLSALIIANENSDPTSWGKSHLEVFEKLENPHLLGSQASSQITTLFSQSNGSYTSFIEHLENQLLRITAVQNQLNQLIASLKPLVGSSEGKSIAGNERHHLLNIHFEDALFIRDINQLEKFCRIWNSILTAFTLLTNEEMEEVRIFDIESNSIAFYAGIKTLNALSNGIYLALQQYARILDIKRIQHEVNSLELVHGEEISLLLDQEMENVVDASTASIAAELLDKYQWTEGSASEVFSAIHVALKQMLSFVERGGVVTSSHASNLKTLNVEVIEKLEQQKSMVPVNSHL